MVINELKKLIVSRMERNIDCLKLAKQRLEETENINTKMEILEEIKYFQHLVFEDETILDFFD